MHTERNKKQIVFVRTCVDLAVANPLFAALPITSLVPGSEPGLGHIRHRTEAIGRTSKHVIKRGPVRASVCEAIHRSVPSHRLKDQIAALLQCKDKRITLDYCEYCFNYSHMHINSCNSLGYLHNACCFCA